MSPPQQQRQVRPYRPGDHDAVYDICVRTAAAGQDARGQYSTDDLMPDLFAGPYVELEPDLAFVLADGGQDDRAVGYIVGTADTARFVEAYHERWIPRLRDRYPYPPDPPRAPEEHLLEGHYHPENRLRPELAGHPAHLHIDLLPEAQGQGHGRALMETWLAATARAGAPAAFLHMDPANTKALGFYRRMGFQELAVPGWGLHLGRPTI